MNACTPAASRAGFTLVELTIVVLVMGILAAVTGPKFVTAMNQAQVRSAARVVVADLDRARQHAMNQGTSQPVVFDAANNTYTLAGMTLPDRPSQAFMVDLSAAAYPAVITSVAFGASGTDTGLTYNASGRPNQGGWVYLEVNGSTQTVMVDGVGGRARLWP